MLVFLAPTQAAEPSLWAFCCSNPLCEQVSKVVGSVMGMVDCLIAEQDQLAKIQDPTQLEIGQPPCCKLTFLYS